MSVLNSFEYHIPEFAEIVNALEKAGIKFDWHLEVPPHLDSGKTTQHLIIEKPGFYFCMRASMEDAGKKGDKETAAPANQKIIPFPTGKRHSA